MAAMLGDDMREGDYMRQRNPWLCVMIVASLAVNAMAGVVGIIILGCLGKPVPGELAWLVSTSVGALAAFLVQPPRGSIGGAPLRPAKREAEGPARP
jgi:hypothetical protein